MVLFMQWRCRRLHIRLRITVTSTQMPGRRGPEFLDYILSDLMIIRSYGFLPDSEQEILQMHVVRMLQRGAHVFYPRYCHKTHDRGLLLVCLHDIGSLIITRLPVII